ncbi:sensor domain-containing diguanylate cyclase [Cupriavidus sp. TMH.W2]|uniref:sensor domain-containing diguanylate cyclase n=1 Tax=Cupriavidus sp. TMH.W2 TaxID=3434465 RepID=UPI003D77BF3F
MPARRLAVVLSSRPSLFTAGAVVIAAIISVLAAVSLYQMRSDALLRARESSENIALILEHDIARNIEVYDLSMQAVIDGVKAPEVMALPPTIRQLVLFDRSSNARDLGSLLVTDATGHVILDSRFAPARSVQIGDRDYFLIHKDQSDSGLFISKPFTPRTQGADTTIGLSRRLADLDGKFSGIVVGTLRINYFKRLFEGVNVGPGGVITLANDDGTIYMRRPYSARVVGSNVSKSVNFDRAKQAKADWFVSVSSIDGVERLYTYRHVGDYPLIMSVGLATSDIYKDWRKRAWVIGGIVVMFDALMLIVSISFAEQLRRRLETEHQLKVLANTDGLTDLATRRTLDSALDTEWRRASRHHQPLAILMIDVDEFKLFNDRYGHTAGDAALRMVARCVRENIRRPGDVAGRYGGEEFCVLLPNTDLVGALMVADKIRASVEAQNEPHAFSEHGRVTVSIGVSVHSGDTRDGDSAAGYLHRADENLYAAKAAGRNCVFPRDRHRASEPDCRATPEIASHAIDGKGDARTLGA